jgi:integrase
MQVVVDLFLDSLKSPETKTQYQFHLNRYLKYCNETKFDFKNSKNRDKITVNIIEYLEGMKRAGLSYSFRNIALSALKHYLTMHDILLNWDKIQKLLGEKEENDIRAFTQEEIGRMLDVSSTFYKMIILTYSSTGMRRAALTELRVKDFEYLPESELYKIRIYRKSKLKQICFTTPETAKYIYPYLKNKSKEDYFHHVAAKSISEELRLILLRAQIVQRHKLGKNEVLGQFRDEVAATHSLRKFTIISMAAAKVDTEVAKILSGHSIGVRDKYVKYTDEHLLEEYKKAIPYLTISRELEFKAKSEKLEARNEQIVNMVDSRLQQKDEQIENLQRQIKSMQKEQREGKDYFKSLIEKMTKEKFDVKLFDDTTYAKVTGEDNKKFNKIVSEATANVTKKPRKIEKK